MGKDLGGIAPGKLADILVFDNLTTIKPTKVFVGGKLVVSSSKLVSKIKSKIIPKWIKQTVKLRKFSENYFHVTSKSSSVEMHSL